MNFRVLILLVFYDLISTSLLSQVQWIKLTQDNNFNIDDIIIKDDSGVFYAAISEHEDVFQIDLNNPGNTKYIDRYVDYPYTSIDKGKTSFFRKFNNDLVVLNGTQIPKVLIDGDFRIDSSHFNGDIPSYSFNQYGLEVDLEGNYFNNYFSSIYKYSKLYQFKGSQKVFDVGKFINYYKPIVDSINFAFCTDRFYEVYLYNTKNNEAKSIIKSSLSSTSTPIATIDGHVFIPTLNGLQHYWDYGNRFELIKIDSVSGYNYINLIYHIPNSKLLVLCENGVFYTSIDFGMSWNFADKLNRNVPLISKGGWDKLRTHINKIIVFDTSQAAMLVSNSCGYNNLYGISPKSGGWYEISLPLNQHTKSIQKLISKANRIIVRDENDCNYYWTEDNGITFNVYKWNDLPVENLISLGTDSLLSWFTQDTNLYFSTDNGNNWILMRNFQSRIFGIQHLTKNKYCLYSITSGNPYPIFTLYLSYDNGFTWIKKFENSLNLSFDVKLTEDRNSTIYIYDRFGYDRIYFSSDEALTFGLCHKYKYVSFISNIEFDENNNSILQATMNNIRGLYFERNDSFTLIKEKFQIFDYHQNGLLSTVNDQEGIFFSYNYGNDWIDISGGLDIDLNKRIPYYISNQFDSNGVLHLSSSNDGIYMTTKTLVDVLDDLTSTSKLNIYPNPTSGLIKFHLSDEISQDSKFILLNEFGQIVLEQNINSTFGTIDITAYNSNVFKLLLVHEKGILFSKLIVKL